MSNPIVVFVEHTGGQARRASLECLGAAHQTGHPVVAVVTGAGAEAVAGTLGNHGAAKAIAITGADTYSPDQTATDVANIAKEQSAAGFLCAATSNGKDLAARVSAHLDSTLFTDCIELAADGDSFKITRPWMAGKALATMKSSSPVLCATTRLNVFEVQTTGGSAEVQTVAASADRKVEVVEIAVNISTARW